MQFEMCGFGFARSTMESLKHIFTIYRAIYETYPGKYKKMLKVWESGKLNAWESGRDLTISVSEIIDVLASLCPGPTGLMFEVNAGRRGGSSVPEAIAPYMICMI